MRQKTHRLPPNRKVSPTILTWMGKVKRVSYSSSPPAAALKSQIVPLHLSKNNLKLKFVKLELYFMFNNLCKRKTLINKQLTLSNKQQQQQHQRLTLSDKKPQKVSAAY